MDTTLMHMTPDLIDQIMVARDAVRSAEESQRRAEAEAEAAAFAAKSQRLLQLLEQALGPDWRQSADVREREDGKPVLAVALGQGVVTFDFISPMPQQEWWVVDGPGGEMRIGVNKHDPLWRWRFLDVIGKVAGLYE